MQASQVFFVESNQMLWTCLDPRGIFAPLLGSSLQIMGPELQGLIVKKNGKYMGVSKIGIPPNHPFNRVFHYKPSILGTPIFGTTHMESQSKMLYFEGPKNLGRNDKPRLQGKKKMSTGRSHWQPPRSRDRWCLVDETDETTRCEWRRDRNSFEFQESIISSTYTKYHQIQHLPSCIYQITRYQNLKKKKQCWRIPGHSWSILNSWA